VKPYGNEQKHDGYWYSDAVNSTKTGARPGNNKTGARRLARKTRRAQDRRELARQVGASD
jgi:hypothetical protein